MKKLYLKPNQTMLSNDGHEFRVVSHASRVLYVYDGALTEYRQGHKLCLDGVPFVVRKRSSPTMYEMAVASCGWEMEAF